MEKNEFKLLFDKALNQAIEQAEKKLGQTVPKKFTIELYGAGVSKVSVDPEVAFDRIYLGPDSFYRIIDLSVIAIKGDKTIIFARISNHKPGKFEQTWNQPQGSGPFKQLLAERIEIA